MNARARWLLRRVRRTAWLLWRSETRAETCRYLAHHARWLLQARCYTTLDAALDALYRCRMRLASPMAAAVAPRDAPPVPAPDAGSQRLRLVTVPLPAVAASVPARPVREAVAVVEGLEERRIARRLLDALRGIRRPVVAVIGGGLSSEAGGTLERELLAAGCIVRVSQPARPFERSRVPGALVPCSDPLEALDGADAVLIWSTSPSLRWLDWRRAHLLMRGTHVFDPHGTLDPSVVAAAGLRHCGDDSATAGAGAPRAATGR